MNTALRDILNKFTDLPDEIEHFGKTVMDDRETQEYILDLNRAQLYEGKRADNSNIQPPYKPYTINEKKKKGQPTDRVTLEDKGDFYRELKIKNTPGKSEIFGTDWKTDLLEEKYNSSGEAVILGLAQQSVEKTRDFLRPDFVSYANKYFER